MESNPKGATVEGVLILAEQLFRRLIPTVPQELLTLDVTMPQLKIMLILFIRGPSRMSDIATELAVTLPTASILVERLVEKGFIFRENQINDRRVVLCRLSAEGYNAIGRLWEPIRSRGSKLLKEMETDKLRMLIEALEAMLKLAETDRSANVRVKKQVMHLKSPDIFMESPAS